MRQPLGIPLWKTPGQFDKLVLIIMTTPKTTVLVDYIQLASMDGGW
jgi:hypothetical protein